MKKVGVLWVFFVLLATGGGAWASVIDAPHNEANGVNCSECHSYSLWWQYSPTNLSSSPDHAAIVDAVCMKCHGLNSIGTEPKVTTHSPTGMGTSSHQNWGVGCTACHNPHYQDQLNWVGSATEPYLVTGQIDNAAYDPILDQTTINYSNATDNVNWPAVGTEAHPSDWANKSVGNPDRGLVLVHDKTATSNTFLILSATTSQVVIKGKVAATAIDPNYTNPQTQIKNSVTCNTFGLIYGQLVRNTIATKAVKFFDPNGGFVEQGTGATGVCQVCHTQALHYKNDGILPGVTDSHSGRETSNCISCHAHNEGFKGGGTHDNQDFGWAGNCATCHNASNQVANIVSDLHGGNCGICHVSPQGAGPLRDGHPDNGIDGSAIGATRTSTCIDCHLTKLSLASRGIHHISKTGYAAAGNCTQCHKSGIGSIVADHVIRVGTDASCVSCHNLTAGTAAGVAVNGNDPKVHDACTTCHKVDGTLKVVYGKAIAMPPGGGNCTACHGVYFPNHSYGHTLNTVPICVNCHVAASAPFATATEAHKNGCQTCHNTATGVLLGSASGKTSGANCQTCHLGYFSGHQHSHTMNTVPLCVSCHATATTAPYVASEQTHSRLACLTCHSATTGALIGSASGKTAGATCQTCHSAYFNGHTKDHENLVKVNIDTSQPINNCINCHVALSSPFVGSVAGEVHSTLSCQTCHNSTNGSLRGSAVAGGGECISCHTAYFGGHSHGHKVVEQASDLSQAASGSLCSTCHSVPTWPAIYTLHYSLCSTCHNETRKTGNPNNVNERVSDVISAKANPTACLSCHWAKKAPAVHGHNIVWNVSDKSSCGVSSCHNSALNSEVVSSVHRNDCALCHVDPANSDFTRRAGGDGTAIGQVLAVPASCSDCHFPSTYPKGVVHHDSPVAVNGNCINCHSGTTYGGNHTALVAADSTCSSASCHPGAAGAATGVPVSALDKKIHDACTTCHEISGALKAAYGKAIAMPNGGPGSNNGGGACTACHGTYFPSHANANHSTRVVDSANCNLCHLTASIVGANSGVPVASANNKVHDDCFTCHNANGSLRAAYGKASAMPAGGGVCEACHGAYFASHATASHNLRVGDTANCNTCHVETAGTATGVPVSTTNNKIHDDCTVCHNSNGSLRTPYSSKAPTMPVGGGTCNACHGAYFVNHVNASHVARVASSQSCTSCHTGTAGSSTSVPVSTSNNKVHDACATCHNSTTGALLAAYGKAPNMAPPGGACEACHGAYINNHTHAHVMPPVSLCLNCHTALTAPYVGSGQAHGTFSCQTCHNATNGQLTGSATGKSAGATCLTCHDGYFNNHNHIHQMVTVSLCVSCHTTATTVPYVAANQTHSRLGCQTCHSGSLGIRIGSAMGKGKGTTCQTCHTSYFNGHIHNHALKMTANVASTPNTSNCKGCHGATVAPFAATGQAHSRLGCATCHDTATNGALIGSAIGQTGNKECITCHTGYFLNHQQHNSAIHNVLMRATDLADGEACATCHSRGGVGSGNPAFVNSWSGTDGIFALHRSDCGFCHNSTRTTNIGIGFTSVSDVIKNGTTVACLNCHANRATGHGGHNEGDGTFGWISSCQTCHGPGGASVAAPKGEIMAGVHSNNCAKCHQGGAPGATLIGSAANAIGHLKPHTCTDCHKAGFNGHSHGGTHDLLMGPADIVNNGAACNECHMRGGTTSTNPLFTNTWDGVDGILALHKGSCVLCHNSTRTENLSGTYASVSDVIRLHTATVRCLDCHADRAETHSSHPAEDFTWSGTCNACHSGANIAVNVHKGKCGLCHVNVNGGGVKRAGKDGSALLAEALPDPRTASCLTCHPVATYRTSGIHHDTRTAASNDCQICHKAINHSTLVTNVTSCSNCHSNTAGTTTGMPVDVANGRVHDSCLTCHTFNATTLAGQLVAPTGKKGVSAMGTGSCTICHTNTTTMHHNNNHSKIGECEYCHADPRNRPGGTNFQETTPSGGLPTHLPCEECHVKPKRGAIVNGWTATAGQMTIYAFNEGGTHSTTDYSSDFTRTVAHSGTHVIGNTVGQINNWGICFSCHDGSGGAGKAGRVNIFHAKPTTYVANRNSCGSSGTARYAPGREARNTIGNFDFFASTFRPRSTKPSGGSNDCGDKESGAASDWSNSIKYGSTNFIATDLLIPDPWSSLSYAVPMFPNQVKNTTTTPSADNVKVTSAVWNGANIVVTAKNTDGCSVLTAVYNGRNQTFIGNGICTATFPQAVEYTSTVTTLNVLTTNPDGIPVLGYRVIDITTQPPGHVEGDGSFIWEATCQNCHGVATDSLSAPNGDIIEGVHSGNCGFCHQGGVGGGGMIGSATRSVGKPEPYKCTECHTGYFDGHLQRSNHNVLMRPTDLSANEACNSCHRRGGTNSANPLFTNTWSGTDGIHAIHQQGCGNCHSSTRTTKIGGGYTSIYNVIMTGTNVGCLDCHANRSAYHGRHFEGDGSFAWVESCQSCHGTGTASTEVQHKGEIIDGVHGAGCGLCHQNGIGGANLIGSATNSDLAPRPHYCTDCHTTYFNSHQRGVSHDLLMRSSDKSAGSPCNYCHKVGGTGSSTPLFVNSWTDVNGIQALHQGGCGNCHTSTRTTNVSAGFTSVQDVILRGTNVSCQNCHDNRLAEHGLHVEGDGAFVWDSSCETCHGVGSVSDQASFGEIIADVHYNLCQSCHLGGIGGGVFTGSAVNVNYGVKPHNCIECHVGSFDVHTRGQGSNHTVLMKAADLANGETCNSCHRRGGTGSTNPLFVNQWDGSNGIMAMHQGGCSQCHQSTRTRNVVAPYTSVNNLIMNMGKTGATPGCLDCHADRTIGHGNHYANDFVWAGTCNTCHTGTNIVVSVHKANCGLCHVNPVGAGPRKAGINGNALLGDASGLKRLATCLTCHPSSTYPMGKIHHNSPSAATNACTVCHAASNHSTMVSGTNTTCVTCHAGNIGTAAGVPVSTADGKVHDTCRTCHTFDANRKGILVAPTNNRGVTAMPAGGTGTSDGGGVCTVCHTTKSSTIHHGNAHAKIGECEWCHADPRNKAGGTLFQEASPAGGIPKHLPCEECHVTPKRGVAPGINGWTATAGQMTIYAYNEGGTHSTTDYSSNFVRTVANSGGHVVSNTVGKINNWGICFSCHDGTAGKAQRVNLFHSKPTSLIATRNSCGDSGTARYAPGREARNTIGNFDFFASTFRPSGTKPSSGSLDCGKSGGVSDYSSSVKYGSTIFTSTDLVIPDPWSTLTYTVPMFAAQTQSTTTTPSADNVQVSSATWDGFNIVVTATNTSGCAALTAVYNGNNKTFVGTGTCTATFVTSVVYNSSVPNLNVTTSNPEGIGVTGYRITDKTKTLGSHSEGDGNFAWVANCTTCHGPSGTSLVAPKGEIIADVHRGECSLCHQGGVAAATLIGSASRATVGVKPHACTECHTGYFDSHIHGAASNHDVLMRGTDLALTEACNVCHRRGGTNSANPLFTNTWGGTNGINALHKLGCGQCHNSTRVVNVKAPYTSVKNVIFTGTNVSCLDCHVSRSNTHAGHDATDFVWAGTCNTCHTGTNIVVDVHKNKCGTCHVNPAGAGVLRAGSNGSGILGVSSGLLRSSTCLTCHPTTTYPTGGIHHDTAPAATNNCTICHATANHSTRVNGAGTGCVSCHMATAGTAAGVPVNMADAKVHDACRTCHTFDLNLRGRLVSPTNKRGVTAMPVGGGVCSVCHTATSAMHHGNAHALVGECEYCHADPRNLAGGSNFQEPVPAGGIPTHLPCEECHVTPKRGVQANGWTAAAGQMTIYAFNEGGSHSTTNYSTDFVRSVANNGGHVIGNTVGKINNWGICLSCHDGSGAAGKAQRVNIFHAKPTTFTATQSSCGTSGTAAFAPGREARNTIGNFDFFASTFRPNSTKPGGSGKCEQPSEWSASVKYGSTIFAASDLVVPDPWSTASYTVPMFAAQTKNTTITPSADNVKVISAIWNGTNITVTATNTSGCSALAAVYNGNNITFTGTTTCTATFGIGVVYSSAVPTLNVTTTNPEGLGVSGYRITIP